MSYAVRFLLGNVPRLLSGAIFVAASNEVIRLTLHDAINMALRYNLGAIESRDNAQITRGQRLNAGSPKAYRVGALDGLNKL